jgi:hypothetical protein
MIMKKIIYVFLLIMSVKVFAMKPEILAQYQYMKMDRTNLFMTELIHQGKRKYSAVEEDFGLNLGIKVNELSIEIHGDLLDILIPKKIDFGLTWLHKGITYKAVGLQYVIKQNTQHSVFNIEAQNDALTIKPKLLYSPTLGVIGFQSLQYDEQPNGYLEDYWLISEKGLGVQYESANQIANSIEE